MAELSTSSHLLRKRGNLPFPSPQSAVATGRTPLRSRDSSDTACSTLAAKPRINVSNFHDQSLQDNPSILLKSPLPSSTFSDSCAEVSTQLVRPLHSSPQIMHRISWPHRVQKSGKPTVGSDPTSCVTPAVSPTVL